MKAATTISGHIKDLGRKDIARVIEIASWLESTTNDQRDIDRRATSKRLSFRLIAAQMLIRAAQGDIQAAREVMDRTEGKVADVVITGNMSDMVKALEAGRSRLLQLRAEPAVEGTVISDPTDSSIQTESLPEDPHKQ